MMKIEIFFISILDTLGRLSEIEIINLLYIPFLKSICIECGKNLPGVKIQTYVQYRHFYLFMKSEKLHGYSYDFAPCVYLHLKRRL